MTKLRSKCLFVVFSIILAILIVASFVNFTYPFAINGNYYKYSNFVSNLTLGEDLSSSIRISYKAELPEGASGLDYTKLKQSTIDGLRSIVQGEGYKDVTIAEQGADYLVMQVGDILSEQDTNNLINLVGDPATISFWTTSSRDEGSLVAKAQDISSVSALDLFNQQTNENVHIVQVNFKNAQAVKEATSSASRIYIFFGEDLFTSDGMPLDEGGITDGSINIQSPMFVDHATANTYANKIRTGMLPLNLTMVETGMITPSYGIGGSISQQYYGIESNILVYIALFVLLIAVFVYLIVRFKQLGWLACFNLLFFVTLGLFFLQSIPLVHINFAGLLGMIICLICAVDTLITIFERAKRYYNNDTKLYVAMKASQKESLIKTFISNGLLILLGFVCVFMPSMAIQSFGWAMLVLPFVNLFTSLVLMRLFIAMYLPLNSLDGKKCNFHKGGNND